MNEAEVYRACKKFVKMAGETLIKHQALVMATSDDKGYDFEKYQQKIRAKMAENDGDSDENKCNDDPVKSENEKTKRKPRNHLRS